MYAFYLIFGIIFILIISLITNNIYYFYSINDFTKFLKPIEKTPYNDISINIMPILLWNLFMTPLFGEYGYFLIGTILNIIISCLVMKIFQNTSDLYDKEKYNVYENIFIIIAVMLGQIIDVSIITISRNFIITPFVSFIGMIILIILFFIFRINPPKVKFFKQKNE